MKDKYQKIADAILGFLLVVALTALIFLCLLCGGCTHKVYVPVERVRTEYREADTAAIFNRLLKIFESRKEREVKTDSLVDRTKETVVSRQKLRFLKPAQAI